MFKICGREENQSGSTVARSKINSKDKVSLISEGITVVLKGSSKSNLEKRTVLTLASQEKFISSSKFYSNNNELKCNICSGAVRAKTKKKQKIKNKPKQRKLKINKTKG